MLFSSLEFLFFFLPLSIIIYFLIAPKYRNLLLLVLSLVFYGFGEPKYLFLMIFTVLANYIFGLLIYKNRKSRKKTKFFLVLSVIFNISLLFVFKYLSAIIDGLKSAELFAPYFENLPTVKLRLPIGISFYVFQSLSYVIDIYREEAKGDSNIVIPATYVAFFPQLIAGPIIKYSDIENQFKKRKYSISGAASGVRRFCVGLSKKVILSNMAGEMHSELLTAMRLDFFDVAGVWLTVIFFAFQIYFDFSGYSDMAIGLGKIFGFDFPENFDYPYISKSITEFWRRWHITLSSWFRNYVYIPLGGNKKGRKRMYLNLFAVWSLTGLWHGASLNFLLWGLYFFLILCLEKAFLLKYLSRIPTFFQHLYAIIFILLGWLIFCADGVGNSLNISEAIYVFKTMCFLSGTKFISQNTKYELSRNVIPLLIMALCSTKIPKKALKKLEKSSKFAVFYPFFMNFSAFFAFILSVSYLVNSGYNPFLYFRF